MKEYSIICNCGHTVKSPDRRKTEAEAWHHAIHEHLDMVKEMSIPQFTEIMKGWDVKFKAENKKV